MGTAIRTTPLTKVKVLMKLITQASDNLLLEVYARIQADRMASGTRWGRSGSVKSWTALVDAAVSEGTLTAEEAALLLLKMGP